MLLRKTPLKNMFLPSKKLIKEQIEYLIEHNIDFVRVIVHLRWECGRGLSPVTGSLTCMVFLCTCIF